MKQKYQISRSGASNNLRQMPTRQHYEDLFSTFYFSSITQNKAEEQTKYVAPLHNNTRLGQAIQVIFFLLYLLGFAVNK